MDEMTIKRLERAADMMDIQNLQALYMEHLCDLHFDRIRDEVMAMDHPEVSFEIAETGAFIGPESVKHFFESMIEGFSSIAPPPGEMRTLMIGTPHIVLSKDGLRAKAQWHCFGPHSLYTSEKGEDRDGSENGKLSAYWFCGKYDNEFIKIDGVWKMLKLHVMVWFRSEIDKGWVLQPDCKPSRPPKGCVPDGPQRYYLYSPNSVFTEGPYLPKDGFEY